MSDNLLNRLGLKKSNNEIFQKYNYKNTKSFLKIQEYIGLIKYYFSQTEHSYQAKIHLENIESEIEKLHELFGKNSEKMFDKIFNNEDKYKNLFEFI